jgi:hypothetical protein
VNFWRENPVFRGAVYALGTVALIALLVHMRHPGASRAATAAASTENDRPSLESSPSPVTNPVVPRRQLNSFEIMASCQPELKETPSAPTFEVGERYNRAGVQLKARFLVDHDGFVMNAYVVGDTGGVTPEDQEAALDYIRHLIFQTRTAEECQTLKIQMIGTFHMSKNSSGDWITIFDAHPVYSFSGGQLVVNPI